jgi:hypothetical protein
MERKVFVLPKHPRRDEQKIVVERPKGGVWNLVIDADKWKPLVNLKNPKSAKEVLDAIAAAYSEDMMAQFIMDGYSKGV